MASLIENLKTARDNLAVKIASITASPKPSYSIDGQSVSHNEHLASLVAQLEAINRLIVQSEPYILVSQVI